MSGYLVFGACAMDDVPLGLFVTDAEARDFAATVTADQVRDAASDVLGEDATQVVCVKVVEFSGGKPLAAILFKSFDE